MKLQDWGADEKLDSEQNRRYTLNVCGVQEAISKHFGVQQEEVQMLLDYGCSSDEIEELFYDPALLHEMIGELCYAY
ncbi:MAG: hypothetical protein AB7C89_05970 [Intestinibacillus sp.]